LNTDNTLLLESFIDDIDNFNDKPLICGGDWNLVLDEKDKKGGSTKLSHTKNREKLKSFIDRNNSNNRDVLSLKKTFASSKTILFYFN
jgi:hypothetical protein